MNGSPKGKMRQSKAAGEEYLDSLGDEVEVAPMKGSSDDVTGTGKKAKA